MKIKNITTIDYSCNYTSENDDSDQNMNDYLNHVCEADDSTSESGTISVDNDSLSQSSISDQNSENNFVMNLNVNGIPLSINNTYDIDSTDSTSDDNSSILNSNHSHINSLNSVLSNVSHRSSISTSSEDDTSSFGTEDLDLNNSDSDNNQTNETNNLSSDTESDNSIEDEATDSSNDANYLNHIGEESNDESEMDDLDNLVDNSNSLQEPLPCLDKIYSKNTPNDANDTSQSVSCSVCLDDHTQILRQKDNSMMATVCGHIFCQNCILTSFAISKKCPMCRKTLKRHQIHHLHL
ncbi:unnamed protein product [Gordionus sp. m RMFG-2023]|uniref:dentin sialophosphoprotein-like n=1 Tax=Gordionus sp. m RMFG-2023 TaxID=3053472 RepID=UPI0030E20A24